MRRSSWKETHFIFFPSFDTILTCLKEGSSLKPAMGFAPSLFSQVTLGTQDALLSIADYTFFFF